MIFYFIDDGSTDGTWEIIKNIKKKNNKKVFLIKRKQREELAKLIKMVCILHIKKNILC